MASCPKNEGVRQLKQQTIEALKGHVLALTRCREDVPLDFRFLQLLSRTTEDPEMGHGTFAQVVRVGSCVLLPRLPTLYLSERR